MAFQKNNVEIYNWILEYLDKQPNKTINFFTIRAETQFTYGLSDDKFNKALVVLENLNPPRIKRSKMGDEVLITKL